MPPIHTVVVGAGVSGLRCAARLRCAHGLSHGEVVVVEATARVGGRCRQAATATGGVVELGAEIVHGTTTEINALAEKHGWALEPLFTWAHGDGCGVPTEPLPDGGHGLYWLGAESTLLRCDTADPDWAALNAAFNALEDDTDDEADEADHDGAPASFFAADDVCECRGPSLAEYLDACAVPARMRSMAEAGYGNTVAASLEDVSVSGVRWLEKRWAAQDGDGDMRMLPSLAALPAALAALPPDGRGLDVRCDWPVKRISWGGAGAAVVESDDGRVLECTKVVLALPVPVVRDGDIAFDPPLPARKLAAAAKIGCRRDAVKMHLRFSKRVYPALCHGIICADAAVPEFWFRPLATADGAVEYLVTAFATAGFAERLLAEGRDDALDRAVRQLDTMFRGTDAEAAASACYLGGSVFNWGDEPRVRCGYTYPAKGQGDAFAVLAEPVGDVLFFAGEATCGIGPGQTCAENGASTTQTMHAAMASGVRAADEAAGKRR